MRILFSYFWVRTLACHSGIGVESMTTKPRATVEDLYQVEDESRTSER